MMHVHPLDALADTLPLVMLDTSSRPVGCSGLAFREPRARPVTRIVSHSKTVPACETGRRRVRYPSPERCLRLDPDGTPYPPRSKALFHLYR